ncbi:hypothetical protein [Aquicella siphonis]|nr:hypothetical protein [Aquicella siphonis]
MKFLISIAGFLAFAMGLLWIGQGLGYIKWPSSSFMISRIQWAYYGGCLAAAGLALIFYARHRG